jgi:hypothetical protein
VRKQLWDGSYSGRPKYNLLRCFSPILGTVPIKIFFKFFSYHTLLYIRKTKYRQKNKIFLLSHHNVILKNPFFCAADFFAAWILSLITNLFLDQVHLCKICQLVSYGVMGKFFQDNCYWSIQISTWYACPAPKV